MKCGDHSSALNRRPLCPSLLRQQMMLIQVGYNPSRPVKKWQRIAALQSGSRA